MKLRSTALPDNILRAMDKKDRAGVMTAEEALLKESHRNEKEMHQKVGQYLRMKGVKAVIHSRMDRATTMDEAGVPDFLFLFQGRACGIELKMPDNDLSREQREMHALMISDGWLVASCYSGEDVVHTFKYWEGLWA